MEELLGLQINCFGLLVIKYNVSYTTKQLKNRAVFNFNLYAFSAIWSLVM